MLKITSLLIAVMGLALSAVGVDAATMHKCVLNGSVTYQQSPCAPTQARTDPTLEELNAAEKKRRAAKTAPAAAESPTEVAPAPAALTTGFRCDGRRYCSQMKSCDEAKYFLRNCPGTEMDGDKNGIPCEKQWCPL